jgi:hypothetical protein
MKVGNINISVNTESKRKPQGTTETEDYTTHNIEVNRYTRGQLGVMIWIHKSILNKIEYYKFWNDKIIGTRLKITEDVFNSIRSICVNRRQGKIK